MAVLCGPLPNGSRIDGIGQTRQAPFRRRQTSGLFGNGCFNNANVSVLGTRHLVAGTQQRLVLRYL